MIKNSPSELPQKTKLPSTSEKQRFIVILQQRLKGTLKALYGQGSLEAQKKHKKRFAAICENVLPMLHGKHKNDTRKGRTTIKIINSVWIFRISGQENLSLKVRR